MPDAFHKIDPRILSAALQIARLCIWLLLLAVIFTPLERLFALHPKKLFRRGVAIDLVYYFLSSLLPAFLLTLPLAIAGWFTRHLLPHSYLAFLSTTPLPARLLASLVVGEIGFYWGHRWSHEIPLLWGFHAIHHSAQEMDFLVNTRAHPVDIVFTRLCGLIPLYLLGLSAPVRGSAGAIPVLVVLIGTLWGFFLHSNLRWRLGWLERIIATPAFHHWHHTNDSADLLNKNYASLLPFVDRLFGTLYLPHDQHPQSYGIDRALSPTLLGQLADPFLPPTRPEPTGGSHPAP